MPYQTRYPRQGTRHAPSAVPAHRVLAPLLGAALFALALLASPPITRADDGVEVRENTEFPRGCQVQSDEGRCAFTRDEAFTVPAGVTSLHVVLRGGRGGDVVYDQGDGPVTVPGGQGAELEGDLTVQPGQKLWFDYGASARGVTPKYERRFECRNGDYCREVATSAKFGSGGGGRPSSVGFVLPGRAASDAPGLAIAAGGGGASVTLGGCFEGLPPVAPAGGDADADGRGGEPCPGVDASARPAT